MLDIEQEALALHQPCPCINQYTLTHDGKASTTKHWQTSNEERDVTFPKKSHLAVAPPGRDPKAGTADENAVTPCQEIMKRDNKQWKSGSTFRMFQPTKMWADAAAAKLGTGICMQKKICKLAQKGGKYIFFPWGPFCRDQTHHFMLLLARTSSLSLLLLSAPAKFESILAAR